MKITFRAKPYIDAAGKERVKIPELGPHHLSCEHNNTQADKLFGSQLACAAAKRALEERGICGSATAADPGVTIERGFLHSVTIQGL